MIVKETERAEEKKEKQKKKKKQKKNITIRNERKHLEVDSRKVASGMPWRWILLAFFSLILPAKS